MANEILKERKLSSNQKTITSLLDSVKVVYTDIDGTLLGPKGSLFLTAEKDYTLKPANAIVEALKNDLDIVFVSGRNRRQLKGDARILGLRNYIAELGSQIVYSLGEEVILNVGDFPATEGSLLETMEKMGVATAVLNKFKGYLEHHTPWSEERECTYVLRGHVNTDEVNSFLKNQGFLDLIFIDNGIIHRQGTTLRKDLKEIHAYHLLPKTVSKINGVRRDRKIRKIDKKNCIAVGDALSDLEIAPAVGIFFLVKNALTKSINWNEAIKKYPNVFITEEKMGLGFAEVIDFILKAA